ncbi:MAG: biotin-dependent carboxyltransferase family protein [Pseudomonadota bacterium]|jgi:allophanate hydrolase|nr:biotin-dependent carboxyltransferase family protein [Pseudomonadota bacterium]
MSDLILIQTAPGHSIQDLGRSGLRNMGLSRGGAADPLALHEAAALLGHCAPVAALEMAGIGGTFTVTAPTRIALTGAPMRAKIGTRDIQWNASHTLHPGEHLIIGAVTAGTYGYLTAAGGFATPEVLNSRSTHRTAGLTFDLQGRMRLPLLPDPNADASPMGLRPDNRFDGGDIRFIAGPQTDLFGVETLTRFQDTAFTRSATANRQGVRLDADTAPFRADMPDGFLSDFILEGDLQMTGDGRPYVLLCECQTIGGYPRIGTVIDADLPRIAQAPMGATLRFRMITLEAADEIAARYAKDIAALSRRATPLIRDPATIPDLLSYQLISGMITGHEPEDQI